MIGIRDDAQREPLLLSIIGTRPASPLSEVENTTTSVAQVMENIGQARKQLAATAAKLGCATMFVCVSNWFDQAIYLDEAGYQYIVNRLERDKLEGDDEYLESLKGIDAVFFAMKFGHVFWFVNDELKAAGFGRPTPQAEP